LILASNAQHTVTYAYDHRGRMVWKTVASPNAPPSTTIQYIWDDFNIVAETVIEDVSTNITYNVWGLDLSGTLQGAGGVGGLLAEVKDGIPCFAAFDANGNVTEYIDGFGNIRAHYEYSPFGELTAQSGGLAGSFTHRFSTKPWCPVTRLSEYLFRKYSPELGQWMSRDPASEQGFNFFNFIGNGFEVYVFVKNNPISIIDRLGLAWRDWQKCEEGKVWKQKKSGNIPAADGCSVPSNSMLGIKDKNNPTEKCSFKSACDQHDNDYSDCTVQKMNADQTFAQNMVNACNNCNLGGLDLQNCYAAASRYAGAVMLLGGGPYKERQQKNCECACE